MNFDIEKFKSKIQKYVITEKKVEEEDKTGATTVIGHVWNHRDVDVIDFNSFTLNDVLFALDAMEEIALFYPEDNDEVFICDPNNPFITYQQLDNSIFRLATAKKIFENDEDEDIFI